MAFSVSAGVNVSEIDATTVVPATSSTTGAISGVFPWGPVGTPVLISNENELAIRFGKPSNFNAETFFVAADFLAYGNSLMVSRAANTADGAGTVGVLSAIANTAAANNLAATILNDDDFEFKAATINANVQFIARYPGDLGNSLKVSQCETAAQFTSSISTSTLFPANTSMNTASSVIVFTPGTRYAEVLMPAANSTIADTLVLTYANTSANAVSSALTTGDLISINGQYLKVANVGAVSATSTANGFIGSYRINFAEEYTQLAATNATSLNRTWEFYNIVDNVPGQSDFVKMFGNTAAADEVHIVVTDEDGKFTGVPGAVLEIYQGLSRATDAKTNDGASLYFKTVINEQSKYAWAASDRALAVSNTAISVVSATNTKPLTLNFAGGASGAAEDVVPLGVVAAGYDIFNSELVDISIVLGGKAFGGSAAGEGLTKYLKDNLIESRKDAVLVASPPKAAVVNNVGSETTAIVAWRNAVGSSSYVVLDSGYKYRYDKYNDVYRYVPLNGDIGGLMVRTDETRDPWFSPAGFNRGQIKNIVKLSFNPNKAHRDVLYKNSINPVVTFPGQGTILYGDKTALAKPSAFDRINVRRLFIVLEKAISTASKFSLFEFNDDFTRAQFRSLVEPFLRDVQGRRGIYDFRVVCDATNNPGEVVDRNEFVGDIYIKPAKSINFIQLNFVAVRTGVEFSEIVGKF